ncbi:hypothetical protein WKH31_14140 [Metabacillus indicus]
MEEHLLRMGLMVVYYGVKIGLLFKKEKPKKNVKKKKNKFKKPPRK